MFKKNRENGSDIKSDAHILLELMKIDVRVLLEIITEVVTNRRCKDCEFYSGISCNSPRYDECTSRIFPVGFKRKKKCKKNKPNI